MTSTTQSGEPVLAWLTRRSERARKSEVEFDDTSLEYRRLFSEVWGTFLLVLVAAGGGVVGALPVGGDLTLAMKALAPGMMVMGIIFFMGTISGAHLNPAVTLAFAVRGNFPWIRVPGYIIAQIVGGILAAVFLNMAYGGILNGANEPGQGISDGTAVLTEAILTLGLVSVILGTAAGRPQRRLQRGPRRRRIHRTRVCLGRADLGRLDEPGAVARADARRRQPRPLLGLPRRPDRGRDDRRRVRVHPSWPGDQGRSRRRPGHPRLAGPGRPLSSLNSRTWSRSPTSRDRAREVRE